MIKDFSYIISEKLLSQLIGYGTDAQSYLVCGYLMRHQFTNLIVFKPYEVEFVLTECIGKTKYNKETKEYTIDGVSIDIRNELIEILNLLCFDLVLFEEYNNGIRFKIKTIFSNEEIAYNRKRFEAIDF